MFSAYVAGGATITCDNWRLLVELLIAIQDLGRKIDRIEVDHGNPAPTPIHGTIYNHCIHKTKQMPADVERWTHVFDLGNQGKLFLDSDGGIELLSNYGTDFFRRPIPFEPHPPLRAD